MKKILLSAALLCLAGTASAQFAWCPEVDTDNYQRFQVSYVNEKLTNIPGDIYEGVGGFSFGYITGLSLTSEYPLFIETGAKLNWNHSVEDFGEDEDAKFTHMSVAIPLNLAYKFTINDRISIQPFAGLNFKFNVVATEKYGDDKLNLLSKDDMGSRDDRGKFFQLGGHFGLGVNLTKFYLGWEYEGDFSKFVEYGKSDEKCKFHTNYLTVGYNF